MFSISWTHCPQGQCWRNLHSDSSFCHRCDTPHVLLNPSIADWYVPLGPMAKSENTPSHSTLHINIRELSDLICRSLNDSVAIGFATRILYATRTSAIVLLGSLLKAEQRRTISPPQTAEVRINYLNGLLFRAQHSLSPFHHKSNPYRHAQD